MKIRIFVMVLCGLLVSVLSARADDRLDRVAARMGITTQIDGSATPNAYATSDGRIFVTRGLLDMVQTDGQLAFVLGHEKAHITRRHHRKSFWSTLGGLALGIGIAKATHASPQGTQDAGAVGAGLIGGHQSRVDEKDADKNGLHYMVEAGYDPEDAVSAMELLQSRLGNGSASVPVLGWFASHPDTGARVTSLRREIRQLPPRSTRPVGPMIVVVEDRRSGFGEIFFFGFRRIPVFSENPSAKIAESLVGFLVSQEPPFDVLEQDELGGLIREQDYVKFGRFDESTLPKIGSLLGVTHVLVVSIQDFDTTSTGRFGVSVGGKRIEGEAAQRRLRLTARLIEAETRLIAWDSMSKLGHEAAMIGSYSDFGFFRRNGIELEGGHNQAGRAVREATRKIAESLRASVKSAPVQPVAPAAPSGAIDATPDPKPAPADKPDCWSNLDRGYAVPGEIWGVYRDADGQLVGKFKAIRLEGRKLFGKRIEGLPPGEGRTCRPLNRAD